LLLITHYEFARVSLLQVEDKAAAAAAATAAAERGGDVAAAAGEYARTEKENQNEIDAKNGNGAFASRGFEFTTPEGLRVPAVGFLPQPVEAPQRDENGRIVVRTRMIKRLKATATKDASVNARTAAAAVVVGTITLASVKCHLTLLLNTHSLSFPFFCALLYLIRCVLCYQQHTYSSLFPSCT
jgi:TRAP-type uncharacterized transport system fused permease subunit